MERTISYDENSDITDTAHNNKNNIDLVFTVQCFLQLFIDDIQNPLDERQYALNIHEWLRLSDIDIDEIFYASQEKGLFILKVMEKYDECIWSSLLKDIIDTNIDFVDNAEYALHILRTEKNYWDNYYREKWEGY